MKRHLSTEQLSSFMDGEVGYAEAQEVEVHLASCPACRARLGSMRRLITEIRRLERPVPPPDLGYQVHAQIAAHGEVRTLRTRVRDLFRSLVLRPSFSAAAMGLAVAVVVVRLFTVPPVPLPDGPRLQIVTVRTTFGEPPLGLPETTSEVAGREFVFSGDRWVQKGLDRWKTPETRVMVASPEGQDMINRYSDLMLLLTDGSRVVMQYRLATVELSKG